MTESANPFDVVRPFRDGSLYSLPALEEAGVGPVSRLPVSIRVVLESVLRNCDGQRVSAADVRILAKWNAAKPAQVEIPFVVSRIVLQDFTGVPLLVDLAAMRDAVKQVGGDPSVIEPWCQLTSWSTTRCRSTARAPRSFPAEPGYRVRAQPRTLRVPQMGPAAFKTFSVVPPAVGIVHQVNLEYLARLVFKQDGVYYRTASSARTAIRP
jgi:aconitate hydratase